MCKIFERWKVESLWSCQVPLPQTLQSFENGPFSFPNCRSLFLLTPPLPSPVCPHLHCLPYLYLLEVAPLPSLPSVVAYLPPDKSPIPHFWSLPQHTTSSAVSEQYFQSITTLLRHLQEFSFTYRIKFKLPIQLFMAFQNLSLASSSAARISLRHLLNSKFSSENFLFCPSLPLITVL